jgi:CheY-like chemotaxis protein
MTNGANVEPFHILLVEDGEADTRLVREALKEYRVLHQLHTVTNGEDAIGFLRQLRGFASAPRPALILLDLNLPGKDGREVLAEIKNDEHLRTIPVVILTSSAAETDIVQTYRLHANCYVVKPVTFDTFVEVMRAIGDFWFAVVRLPSADRAEAEAPPALVESGALRSPGRS